MVIIEGYDPKKPTIIMMKYSPQELKEVTDKWRGKARMIIGPDQFTMIYFKNHQDMNWFKLEWSGR